jgi:dTMP kinase
MEKGKFIVFEGIDGCGKSSQFSSFAKYLFSKSKYNHIVLTREPYQSREIRNILATTKDPYQQAVLLAKLFVQDRIGHLKRVVIPSLDIGLDVVSDRYKHSTIAYQAAQGLPIQELIDMHKQLLVPDITFIFDVPTEIAKQRMLKDTRQVEQKFEKSLEFQEKVRQNYLKMPLLLPNEKIVIINGNRSIEEVTKDVQEIYEKFVND